MMSSTSWDDQCSRLWRTISIPWALADGDSKGTNLFFANDVDGQAGKVQELKDLCRCSTQLLRRQVQRKKSKIHSLEHIDQWTRLGTVSIFDNLSLLLWCKYIFRKGKLCRSNTTGSRSVTGKIVIRLFSTICLVRFWGVSIRIVGTLWLSSIVL